MNQKNLKENYDINLEKKVKVKIHFFNSFFILEI